MKLPHNIAINLNGLLYDNPIHVIRISVPNIESFIHSQQYDLFPCGLKQFIQLRLLLPVGVIMSCRASLCWSFFDWLRLLKFPDSLSIFAFDCVWFLLLVILNHYIKGLRCKSRNLTH